MELETLEIAVVTLLLIISAVGVVVRYLRLPYPIALVLTGLAVGTLSRGALPVLRDLPLEEARLTPEVILLLLLPALLFEATLHIEVVALRRTLLPVTLLAVPGVLVNAMIVGALIHWGVGLTWPVALLFGAVVAATDPIAVLAIFKKLHAPRGLELLVEGESLFNSVPLTRACQMASSLIFRPQFEPSHNVSLLIAGSEKDDRDSQFTVQCTRQVKPTLIGQTKSIQMR